MADKVFKGRLRPSGGIACRVFTHVWNTEEQVDLLLGVLKDKLAKVRPGA